MKPGTLTPPSNGVSLPKNKTNLKFPFFLYFVFLPPLKGSFNPPNQLAPPLSDVTTSTVSLPR